MDRIKTYSPPQGNSYLRPREYLESGPSKTTSLFLQEPPTRGGRSDRVREAASTAHQSPPPRRPFASRLPEPAGRTPSLIYMINLYCTSWVSDLLVLDKISFYPIILLSHEGRDFAFPQGRNRALASTGPKEGTALPWETTRNKMVATKFEPPSFPPHPFINSPFSRK